MFSMFLTNGTGCFGSVLKTLECSSSTAPGAEPGKFLCRTFFPRSGGRWFKTQRQQRVDPAFHPFGVGEMGTSLDGCLDRRVQRF